MGELSCSLEYGRDQLTNQRRKKTPFFNMRNCRACPNPINLSTFRHGTSSPLPRDASIQIIPTLDPKVCKYYLHWAVLIPDLSGLP